MAIKKKIIEHLKDDMKTFKKEINDDKKLVKDIKRKKK